jgi:hypothetical protein
MILRSRAMQAMKGGHLITDHLLLGSDELG